MFTRLDQRTFTKIAEHWLKGFQMIFDTTFCDENCSMRVPLETNLLIFSKMKNAKR